MNSSISVIVTSNDQIKTCTTWIFLTINPYASRNVVGVDDIDLKTKGRQRKESKDWLSMDCVTLGDMWLWQFQVPSFSFFFFLTWSARGPRVMVGEAWSWKGNFCPDSGHADLSGLYLASPKFPQNCPDLHIWPIFRPKIVRICWIWPKISG